MYAGHCSSCICPRWTKAPARDDGLVNCGWCKKRVHTLAEIPQCKKKQDEFANNMEKGLLLLRDALIAEREDL